MLTFSYVTPCSQRAKKTIMSQGERQRALSVVLDPMLCSLTHSTTGLASDAFTTRQKNSLLPHLSGDSSRRQRLKQRQRQACATAKLRRRRRHHALPRQPSGPATSRHKFSASQCDVIRPEGRARASPFGPPPYNGN